MSQKHEPNSNPQTALRVVGSCILVPTKCCRPRKYSETSTHTHTHAVKKHKNEMHAPQVLHHEGPQLHSNQEMDSPHSVSHFPLCVTMQMNNLPPLHCHPAPPHPTPCHRSPLHIPPICSTSPYLIVQNDTFTFYGEPIILSYTVRWLCKPTCPDQLGSGVEGRRWLAVGYSLREGKKRMRETEREREREQAKKVKKTTDTGSR